MGIFKEIEAGGAYGSRYASPACFLFRVLPPIDKKEITPAREIVDKVSCLDYS